MFQQKPRKTSLRKSKKAREVIFSTFLFLLHVSTAIVCCGVTVSGFVFRLMIDYVCKYNFQKREKNEKK